MPSLQLPDPMKQFQPPGFEPQHIQTSLGKMVYYSPARAPWRSPIETTSPPLVFLHSLGGGSSAFEWSKVYPAFAAIHRIIAPDLVGWGQSAHPPRDYSIADYLAVITECLEQVAQQPATVVSTSLTAGLVLRLASQRPDLFDSLFLVSPSGYSDFGQDYQSGLAAQLAGTPILDRIIYTLGAANELAVRNFLEQFLFAKRSRITDEMVAAYVASAQQENAEYAALASLKGSLCFDLSLYIDALQTPTFMLWGAASRFTSVAQGQRLASLNPAAVKDFVSMDDVGVLPHLELPAVVIGLLQSWLQADHT
ncbi:MAG: alpha/beta hydrolase [Elainellaceae cyanobacterium]